MNALADQFANQGVAAYFLYTHEAHPGENYPHLTSMTQKFNHARDLRDQLGVARPIVVDALDGACHRAYGSMPNMTWIFNRAGIPVYKSDWSDAGSVENALAYFIGVRQRRKAGERLAPFNVHRLDYRIQDRQAFYQGLERSGHRAVSEFRETFG
jgi:hypothetical protein